MEPCENSRAHAKSLVARQRRNFDGRHNFHTDLRCCMSHTPKKVLKNELVLGETRHLNLLACSTTYGIYCVNCGAQTMWQGIFSVILRSMRVVRTAKKIWGSSCGHTLCYMHQNPETPRWAVRGIVPEKMYRIQ